MHFPSCAPEAQAALDETMKLQHSFWCEAAGHDFRRVRERDPNCAMTYWGEAMALLVNPFAVTTAANLRSDRAALAEARRNGAKTEREAGFIDALRELYGDEDPSQHRARVGRYEQAMGRLHARFPDGSEVTFATPSPSPWPRRRPTRPMPSSFAPGELLQREADREPQHPGAQRYLIHAYDVPALAQRGLPAAERYTDLAEVAPHALHMPSHIFTRVGLWE